MFDHALEAEGSVLVELGYQGDAFFPVQLCGKLAELLQYLADDGFHGLFRGGGKGLLGTVIAAVFGGGRAYLVFQGGDGGHLAGDVLVDAHGEDRHALVVLDVDQ